MRRKWTIMSAMMNYSQDLQKNLKQGDTETLDHGDGNEDVNDESKCNKRLPKRSAAIDAVWRRRALNQFDDGSD